MIFKFTVYFCYRLILLSYIVVVNEEKKYFPSSAIMSISTIYNLLYFDCPTSCYLILWYVLKIFVKE